MVLSLKRWKSRTPPGLETGAARRKTHSQTQNPTGAIAPVAGWSSPVARQAHNLKVTGSNPVPATILTCEANASTEKSAGAALRSALEHGDKIDPNSPHRSIASVLPTGVSVIDSISERIMPAASS